MIYKRLILAKLLLINTSSTRNSRRASLVVRTHLASLLTRGQTVSNAASRSCSWKCLIISDLFPNLRQSGSCRSPRPTYSLDHHYLRSNGVGRVGGRQRRI